MFESYGLMLALAAAALATVTPHEEFVQVCADETQYLANKMERDKPTDALFKSREAYQAWMARDDAFRAEMEDRRRRHASRLSLSPEGLDLLNKVCDRMNLTYMEGVREGNERK